MTRTSWLYPAAVVAGLSAPALILFCAVATDAGWLSFAFSFGVLTLKVAWVLIWVGLSMGLTALAIWLRRRGSRRDLVLALVAIAAPVLTFAGFQMVRAEVFGHPPVHETSTDWTDPPVFTAARGPDAWPVESDPRVPADVGDIHPAWAPWAGRRVAEINAETCPGARTIPRLTPASDVVAALEAEGVRVSGQGQWRVHGVRDRIFYGRARDVVVRMEPGATDVRVSERVGLGDRGETCRLVSAIVARLGG